MNRCYLKMFIKKKSDIGFGINYLSSVGCMVSFCQRYSILINSAYCQILSKGFVRKNGWKNQLFCEKKYNRANV